jgi:hypothetical protein
MWTCSNTGCRQHLAHGALARRFHHLGRRPPLGPLPSSPTPPPPPAAGATGTLPAPAAETGGATWWRREGTGLWTRARSCCGEGGGRYRPRAGCGGGGSPGSALRAPQRRRPPRFPIRFLGKAVGSVYLSSCVGTLFLWKINWTFAIALYMEPCLGALKEALS